MSVNIRPDGTTVYDRESSSGARVNNLGALVAGPRQLTQDTMAETLIGTVAGGVTAVVVLPVMPVGSEFRFIVALADDTAFLTLQELDQAGVAQGLQFRNAAGAAVDFNTVAPILDGAAAVIVLADNIQFGTGAAGRLEQEDATFITGGTYCVSLQKIRPNAANLADGWMVTFLGGCTST